MRFDIRKACVAVAVFSSLLVLSQTANVATPPKADPAQMLQFLGKTVSWYRQLAVEQQMATQPSELTFVQDNRRLAGQAVQLAFDYARSQAQLQRKKPATQQANQQPQQDNAAQYQGLTQAAQKADQEVQQTEAELQTTREQLANASAKKKGLLQSKIAELQSELGLIQARRDAIQTMVEFVNTSSSESSGTGLRAQIEELARSVPAAISGNQTGNQNQQANQSQAAAEAAPAASVSVTPKTTPTGIWGLASDLLRLSGKLHTLKDQLSATNELQQTAKTLRSPFLSYMKDLVQQGDQLFAAADTSGPSALLQETQQIDNLTTQFKQTSGALLPLSKMSVVLDAYSRSLTNWREEVRDELHEELGELLLRLGILLLLVAAVLGVGEIWRRTIFRYVHDNRRRYQFLLLRRVAMWIAITVIIVLGFATQLGSAVTFAGLLTAGVAVALQNVIVSVVAYFFLIGKYGIRVGDRVTIAGVTGEVVDIGLVRIHLMELGGPGELQPSGRVVAFSNSIVFQPTSGVFKQIPGTSFVWHELKLTLAADSDYHAAKDRIAQAVEHALADYRDSMESQRREMERSLTSVSTAELGPKIRMHYTGSGIEANVRFPVGFDKSAEIDDHVLKEVMAEFDHEPKLKLIGAEMSMTGASV